MRVAAILVLAGACAPPAPDDTGAAAEITVVDRAYTLDDDAYAFCHEAGADAIDAREWCDVLSHVPAERCPGLRETCAMAASEVPMPPMGCFGMPGAPTAPTNQPVGAPEPPDAAPEPWEPPELSCSCDPPQDAVGWAALVLQWVGAVLVALLVLVVLRLVLWAIRSRRRTEAEEPEVDFGLAGTVVDDPAAIPQAPSEDLLAAAERALDEGRVEEAVLLARAATLRRLGEAGRIRLHRARTDREYLRSLRRDEAIHGPLSVVLGAVERLRWGGGLADAAAARAVLSAARKLVGTLAVAVALLLVVGADADTRYGAEGDAAIADLYALAGYDVSWRLRALATVDDDVDVLVLDLAGVTPAADDWDALRAWVGRGHLLVVAGVGEVPLEELGPAVELAGPVLSAGFDLPPPVLPGGFWKGWPRGRGAPIVVAHPGGEHVVTRLPIGDGDIVAISDARLLWNAALVVPDNEAFLLGLVGAFAGDPLPEDRARTVIQLALFSGGGAATPVGALWNARLLPAVLQLLITVGLGALWLGWPFAPLKDPPSVERTRFRDHVVALGARFRRTRAAAWAYTAYARWALGRYGASGLRAAAERRGRSRTDAAAWVAAVERAAGSPRTTPTNLEDLEDLWTTLHPD